MRFSAPKGCRLGRTRHFRSSAALERKQPGSKWSFNLSVERGASRVRLEESKGPVDAVASSKVWLRCSCRSAHDSGNLGLVG
jgi:hypothetical protein